MINDFNPINPHNRRLKTPEPRMEPLFQVHVETREGNQIAVGPKMIRRFAADLLAAINTEIIKGTEKDWSNPHLIQKT